VRSGFAIGRFWWSRKVNRSRFAPQVRLPLLFTSTGKTVGAVDAVFQPAWSAGGAGAATQAVPPDPVGASDDTDVAAGPPYVWLEVAPPQAATSAATARMGVRRCMRSGIARA